MKKQDWATKAAKAMQPNIRLFANDGTPADSVFVQWMSRKLRDAERRGYKRAIKHYESVCDNCENNKLDCACRDKR